MDARARVGAAFLSASGARPAYTRLVGTRRTLLRAGNHRTVGRPGLSPDALRSLRPGAAARRAAFLGPDAVACLHCGLRFRAIRRKHLRVIHGYGSRDAVAAYRRRWGVGVGATTCRLLRQKYRSGLVRRWTGLGRRWPRARVIAEIRHLAARRRRFGSSGGVPRPIRSAAKRHFRTWPRALRAAGVRPAQLKVAPKVPLAEVLAGVRRLHAAGRPVTQKATLRGHPSWIYVGRREVGAWRAVLKAAGLPAAAGRAPPEWAAPRRPPGPGGARTRRRKWTPEAAAAWVRRAGASGRPVAERNAPGGLVGFVRETLRRPWPAYVRGLGCRDALRREPVAWSRAAVVRLLRRRYREGKAMNADAVWRDDQRLRKHTARYFASWPAALKAAGLAGEGRVRLGHSLW